MKFKLNARCVKLQKKFNEIYKNIIDEENRIIKIMQKQAKKIRKIFPDINEIFASPQAGGPFINFYTARRMAAHPESGALIAYFFLKHPRIAKQIYFSANPNEQINETVLLNKDFLKLEKKYLKHEAKRYSNKRLKVKGRQASA